MEPSKFTVALLGLGGDGKTELVHSTAGWMFNRSYRPTSGIVKYTMELPSTEEYCILDFPGQVLFSLSGYSNILKNVDQIFLCIDMSRMRYSDTVKRIEKFLKDHRLEYTVVGTKADIIKDDNKDFYYDFVTSAKGGYSIFHGKIKFCETFNFN